ncbi:hypothetical protein [Rhizobium leguminosarum]
MAAFVYQRPKLYKLQSEAFFNDFRYAWIEGSTKSGKTVSCMAWIIEQAVFLGKEGREFWWVAPVSAVASIAFKRLKRGIPSYFIRSIISSPGKESITRINGAVIRFKSGENANSLYGEDVWAAVIDEASRMKEDVFHAIRSTLTATRGKVRIIGNVKGRKNWLFRGCRKFSPFDPRGIFATHGRQAQSPVFKPFFSRY